MKKIIVLIVIIATLGLLAGLVGIIFRFGIFYKTSADPVPLEAMRQCYSAADCEPVGCGCDCSGCGGFSFEDMVNKQYVNSWYKQKSCKPADVCPMVCCMARTIACESNICVAK